MLDQAWEEYAVWLANASNSQELEQVINKIVQVAKINTDAPASVIVGRDTRPSGEALTKSLMDGVEALGGKIQDFGLVTTPQLHYLTRSLNTLNTPESYGEPSNQGYYAKLATAFKKIVVCPFHLKFK